MRVSCVDPGPHVGWATWFDVISLEQSEDTFLHPWRFFSGEMTPEELFDRAPGLVDASDIVVCEAFNIGGSRARSSNDTIEQIGILRYLCREQKVRFVESPPGLGKRFAGKGWSTLKILDWYRPGPDHANSAAGHLLSYLVQERLIDPKLLLE